MRLTWARSVQDVTFNPLLAGIIGAGRSWTAGTISVLSIPRRYTEVIARSAWPSWRWMTSSGTPEQYVSLAFGRAAGQAGIAVSMGSRGDAYDNAVAETFFATLKKELVNRRSWHPGSSCSPPCSNTSRPSTTASVVTPPSGCCPPSPMNNNGSRR